MDRETRARGGPGPVAGEQDPRRAALGGGPVTWLGLAWVYAGALFLAGLFARAAAGEPEAAAAMGLRLAATLAIGIGLCGTERWAWAAAVCLGGVYAAGAAVLAGTAGWAILSRPPGTLSWTPILYGLTTLQAGRVGIAACLAAAAALLTTRLLWRAQDQYDVPYRRPYTMIARVGVWPAGAVIATDLFLLAWWWSASVR